MGLLSLHISTSSSHSFGSSSLHFSPGGFHLVKLGLDLLLLSLGCSESPSPVSISVWIIAILWTFSTPSLFWAFLEEVYWVVISDLSELREMSEDWASSVSVVVVGSSECLSNDPGEVLPELVLGGGHFNHIKISSFFNIGLDFVLSSLESHFKSFSDRSKDGNESRGLTVEEGLGSNVVSSESSLLLSKSKLGGVDSSSGGRSEGGHSVGSIDGDVSGDLVSNPLAVWLDTISMGLTINVGVKSNDSGVIDELFKVSDLTSVVWATWA